MSERQLDAPSTLCRDFSNRRHDALRVARARRIYWSTLARIKYGWTRCWFHSCKAIIIETTADTVDKRYFWKYRQPYDGTVRYGGTKTAFPYNNLSTSERLNAVIHQRQQNLWGQPSVSVLQRAFYRKRKKSTEDCLIVLGRRLETVCVSITAWTAGRETGSAYGVVLAAVPASSPHRCLMRHILPYFTPPKRIGSRQTRWQLASTSSLLKSRIEDSQRSSGFSTYWEIKMLFEVKC